MPATTRTLCLAALLSALSACGDDAKTAEDAAQWLQDRYLFRSFGAIGEITRVYVENAGTVRMVVHLTDKERAELIDDQTLMNQSRIAHYACPNRASKVWPMLGEAVVLRVDMKTASQPIASAICKPK